MLGIILSLTSCIKDSLLDDKDDSGGSDIYGNHLSLAITIPMSKGYSVTRASSSDMGSLTEVLVDGVRIVLYNDADKIVKCCWDLDIQLKLNSSNALTASGSDLYSWEISDESILIQAQAQEGVYSGDFHLLIIVNPNVAIKAITEIGSAMSDITTGIFDTTANNSMYRTASNITGIEDGSPVYFLMLNHQGLIPLTNSDFYKTKKEAEENPVWGKVERVAAKVNIGYHISEPEDMDPADTDDWRPGATPYGRFVMLLDNQVRTTAPTAPWGEDYDIPDYPADTRYNWNRITKKASPTENIYYHSANESGPMNTMVRYLTATDIKWHLDVVNKKSYWLRHITNKAGSLGMEKQGDTDQENFYAEDPNFTVAGTTLSDFRYLTIDDFTYTNGMNYSPRRLPPPSYEYFKLPDINLASYWSWTEGDGPMYIAESTMEKDAQTGDKATRVIFEITLRRDRNNINTNGNTNTTSPPPVVEPFFVFKGGIQDASKYTYNNVYYENGVKKYFYIIWPQDMALYASGTVTDSQITASFRKGLLDEIEKFKLANPGFNFSNWANEDAAQSENLIFYNSGKLYYEIPIEHFTKTEAGGSGEYGRFGVVRNNWYKLNINEIFSLGSLTIPMVNTELIEASGSTRTSDRMRNGMGVGFVK